MKCENCGHSSIFLRKKYCKNCECQYCKQQTLIKYKNQFCELCVCLICLANRKTTNYNNCYLCNFNNKYYGTF